MGADPLELTGSGCRKYDGPVGRVERRKHRGAVGDQRIAVGDEELPAVGDKRAHPGQSFVVTAGHFEDGEAPDASSFVALVDGSTQQVVIECARTEAHHDQARRSAFITKGSRREVVTERDVSGG